MLSEDINVMLFPCKNTLFFGHNLYHEMANYPKMTFLFYNNLTIRYF